MAEPVAQEPAVALPHAKPRVIYVMGAGRSGSTIFGVTMGNCQGVFYAGELDAWLSRAGESSIEDPERTRFWGEIRKDVEGAAELFGRDAERSLERSMSLLRISKWAARRRIRGPYRRVASSLYHAIGRATAADVIVDTSHYPLRARELQELGDIDLHLIYLVRDPRSVVASFNRRDVAQYSKSTLTTNVYLWLTNALSVLTFLRHPRDRRMLVHYEDFVADPQRVVRVVLDSVGLSVPLPDLSRLRTGVAFQGNRVLASPEVALGGESGSSPRSLLTSVLQLPWQLLLPRLRPRARQATPEVQADAARQ